jgi:hypothetical protein
MNTIDICYTTGGIFSSFQSPQTSKMKENFIFPILSNWTDQTIFMVSHGNGNVNYGLMLWRKTYYPALIIEGYVYRERLGDRLQILSIDPIGPSEIYVGFLNYDQNKIGILNVLFNNTC